MRRLRAGGVMVRPRFARDDPSTVTGFAVSLSDEPGVRGPHPDSLTVEADRRWYPAGKLAKDLSLPALRAGWGPVADQHAAWTGRTPAGRETATRVNDAAYPAAARRAREVTEALAGVDPLDRQRWAEAARDAAGVHAQLAARLDGDGRAGHQALADTWPARPRWATTARPGCRRCKGWPRWPLRPPRWGPKVQHKGGSSSQPSWPASRRRSPKPIGPVKNSIVPARSSPPLRPSPLNGPGRCPRRCLTGPGRWVEHPQQRCPRPKPNKALEGDHGPRRHPRRPRSGPHDPSRHRRLQRSRPTPRTLSVRVR